MRGQYARGLVAAVTLVSAVALAVPVGAKDTTRDFPNSNWCPVHRGPVATTPNPLVFQAPGPTATLSFLACDDRNAKEILIDDVMVIERTVFDNDTNRLSYPDGQSGKSLEAYGIDLRIPFNGEITPACYQSDEFVDRSVKTVFDRDLSCRPSRAIPFKDDFEDGNRSGWALVNASIQKDLSAFHYDAQAVQTTELRGVLRLTSTQSSPTCSAASVTVYGLAKNREYVVDFSWGVKDFDPDRPTLTVSLDNQFRVIAAR
jgi:hypothetical protein